MTTRIVIAAMVLSAWTGAAMAQNDSASQSRDPSARAECAPDVKQFCADVQPGGGRILRCLRQNRDKISQSCKEAFAVLRRPERKTAPAD